MFSNAQLIASKNIILEAFDVELIRCSNKDDVIKFFASFLLETNFFSLLTAQVYTHTANNVFSNSIVREFILNLTDRVAVRHSIQELSVDELNETLVSGFVNHRSFNTAVGKCLIPEKVCQTIYLQRKDTEELLHDNFWYSCMIVLSLFVNEVSILAGTFKIDR